MECGGLSPSHNYLTLETFPLLLLNKGYFNDHASELKNILVHTQVHCILFQQQFKHRIAHSQKCFTAKVKEYIFPH